MGAKFQDENYYQNLAFSINFAYGTYTIIRIRTLVQHNKNSPQTC